MNSITTPTTTPPTSPRIRISISFLLGDRGTVSRLIFPHSSLLSKGTQRNLQRSWIWTPIRSMSTNILRLHKVFLISIDRTCPLPPTMDGVNLTQRSRPGFRGSVNQAFHQSPLMDLPPMLTTGQCSLAQVTPLREIIFIQPRFGGKRSKGDLTVKGSRLRKGCPLATRRQCHFSRPSSLPISSHQTALVA